MAHSIFCIQDLNTSKAPEEVSPLNFWILGSRVHLNSEANICIVFRKTDSVIVSSFGALGGIVNLMLLTSGLIGVLAKCTCFASLYPPRVRSPKVSSVVMAAPHFLFMVGGK